MQKTKNKKILKIGVIGVGNRGGIAIHAHQPQNNIQIIAGADLNNNFLKQFQQKISVPIFTSNNYREIINHPQIDAIIICTPDYYHEEHTCAALNAHKAVFLEKPMALTPQSCDKILHTAIQNKTKLYVGHNMRHMPFLTTIKTEIEQGSIGTPKTIWVRHFISRGGDCYFKDWHADRTKSNSLLVHKATHDIDAIHWLANSYTNHCNAMGNLTLYNQIQDRDPNPPIGKQDRSTNYWPPLTLKGLNPIITTEDLSTINMRLNNGIIACYQQCHYTPDYWRNFTIIGTKGRIENIGSRGNNVSIKIYQHKIAGYSEQADKTIHISNTEKNQNIDKTIINEFLNYIRYNTPTKTNLLAARQAVATAHAATQSIRNGAIPQQISPLPKSLHKYLNNQPQE